MNDDQDSNDHRDDERKRDKERKTKKPHERDEDHKNKDNYEDSGGANRETSREMMIRQTNVQGNGRFAGFSFLVYLFRLLLGPVTATRLIREFIAAINGNQKNGLVRRTNYPSCDREGPNQTFVFTIYLAPTHPRTRNVSVTFSVGDPCLQERNGLALPQVFRTPENWGFTRTAMLSRRLVLATATNIMFCQLWMFASASTSQTSSPDIVIPAFLENEDTSLIVAGGCTFRRARTVIGASVYQLFLLTEFRFEFLSEEIWQQLINPLQRVLPYDENPAINTIAGFVPALASGDNIQTMMFGVVCTGECLWATSGRRYLPQGIVYNTVPRIPAASSRFGESSFLDNMGPTADLILSNGARQMIHDGRQVDDYIAEGEHEVYVSDQVTENAEESPNTDTLLKYPTQCEDPQVTPTSTSEYSRSAGQAEEPKDLSNEEASCKFPVMETGWEINVNDVQDNGATDAMNEVTNSGVPIQCEDPHSAHHINEWGAMSRDYANGAPDSSSHGGARSQPATQGRLQMRRAGLYAQCDEDLYFEYVWKLEESNHRLRRSLLCPECYAVPWNVVLIPCGHLLCSYCYQGQRICPICSKEVATSSQALLS